MNTTSIQWWGLSNSLTLIFLVLAHNRHMTGWQLQYLSGFGYTDLLLHCVKTAWQLLKVVLLELKDVYCSSGPWERQIEGLWKVCKYLDFGSILLGWRALVAIWIFSHFKFNYPKKLLNNIKFLSLNYSNKRWCILDVQESNKHHKLTQCHKFGWRSGTDSSEVCAVQGEAVTVLWLSNRLPQGQGVQS